jgi:uncharacterized repeat protein (TIGR03803 family)
MRVRPLATLIPVLLLAVGASAVRETVLHTFGGRGDGSLALDSGTVVRDSSGNLYGTTESGGKYGAGTVFELTSDGVETVLHSFQGGNKDGGGPYAGVTIDSSGVIYGTTLTGGMYTEGVVFKLAKSKSGSWSITLLHQFSGKVNDGGSPEGGVILGPGSPGKKGCCYGTTYGGGANGLGTVFEISSSGKFSVLYSFCSQLDCADGQNPSAGLVLGNDGNFYGTTQFGGISGHGTVFQLSRSSSGWTETVLHNFGGPGDGEEPEYGSLIFDQAGKIIFGVTSSGGQSGFGTVFELTPASSSEWTETLLHSFEGGSDGATPCGSLATDTHGNLYGTAYNHGSGHGVVFKLTQNRENKTWSETVLHSFNGKDGAYPQSGVVVDSTGSLFGVTLEGGGAGAGYGVAYKIGP